MGACCSVHGGAGVLISIGLMEKIPLSFMETCMASMTGTGEAILAGFPNPSTPLKAQRALHHSSTCSCSSVLTLYITGMKIGGSGQCAMQQTSQQLSMFLFMHTVLLRALMYCRMLCVSDFRRVFGDVVFLSVLDWFCWCLTDAVVQVVTPSYLGVCGRQVMPSQIQGTVSTTGKQRALILVQNPAGN